MTAYATAVIRDGSSWTPTATGGAFPLLNPKPEDVDFRDIAEGLAKACRFAGQIPTFYTVAQHSVIVAQMLPIEARPYGLIHDAHEAFLCDITTPVKAALTMLGGGPAWNALVHGLDAAIHAAAGLQWPLPPAIAESVEHADRVAFATERRDIHPEAPLLWEIDLPAPRAAVIKPWPWHRALDIYTDRLRRWLPVELG